MATPTVHLLGTGGTVANLTGDYDDASNFAALDTLLDRAPDDLAMGVSLDYTEITRLGSSSLTPEVLFDLHKQIHDLAAATDPPDGVVITHGSNTVEETAYFLELTLDSPFPVVLTAAQRRPDELGSDAFRNIADAVRVAATPAARDRGVLLVVNEEIHHARDVVKLAAFRPDAWSSPNYGRVGDAGPEVTFGRIPDRGNEPFNLAGVTSAEFPLTDVHVLSAALGADGTAVDAVAGRDPAGLVVAGFPTGTGARTGQVGRLREAAAAGVPIVMCNRGLEGIKSVEEVFVSAGTLRPQKARILLALGLLETSDREDLQTLFDRH